MVRCERINTALRDRLWTWRAGGSDKRWNGLLMLSGDGVIEEPGQQYWLEPSMVFLAPTNIARSMRIMAGADGIFFTFDQSRVFAAAGQGPDAQALRDVLENRLVVRLDSEQAGLVEINRALSMLINETRLDSPGQHTLLDAALKIILVVLLRNMPQVSALPTGSDRSTRLLQRFRYVLEVHFRERWSVARYAKTLGIGSDRLHDLCTDRLGKTPSELIAERTCFEAKILLQSSALSVANVSSRLGFKDPSHFSRYFSRVNNSSPRAYRNSLCESSDPETSIDFADWP